MTTISDMPETAGRRHMKPLSPDAPPKSFTQVFEILWQLAVEEFPAWSHEQKRRWAENTANQMFADSAGPRRPFAFR